MPRKLEGYHMGFLQQITRHRADQQKDGTWRQVAEETVLEKTGTQPLRTYIDRSKAKVAELVVLNPILEVCDIETYCEGGGRRRDPWWRQTAARKQMSATLKDILAAARERRWKLCRRGGGGGDRDTEESEDGAGSDGYWDSGTDTCDA